MIETEELIDEAEEVRNNNSNPGAEPTEEEIQTAHELHEKLRQSNYQHKSPGGAGAGSGGSAEGNGKVSSAWLEDDFKEDVQPAAKTKINREEEEEIPPGSQEAIRRIPNFKEKARASAQITTQSIESIELMIFTMIVNFRFKKKFTDEEIELIEKIEDKDDKMLLEDKEKEIMNKWNRLMKRRDKKLKELEFDDREKKNMELMWEAKQEYDGKLMSPTVGLTLAIINSIVNRSITALTQ